MWQEVLAHEDYFTSEVPLPIQVFESHTLQGWPLPEGETAGSPGVLPAWGVSTNLVGPVQGLLLGPIFGRLVHQQLMGTT